LLRETDIEIATPWSAAQAFRHGAARARSAERERALHGHHRGALILFKTRRERLQTVGWLSVRNADSQTNSRLASQ